ncbi:MAG: branched-chain amino acid ABC transporter permease [Bdellovibrionota bacterium]|jgi:branched-chain amino acid transport system permease protein
MNTEYLLTIFIFINIYIILSSSLNLIVGLGGMMSLCHAAFYGLGAYIGALALLNLGCSFFLATLLAIIGCSLLSIAVAYLSLRLKGDYFVLASLGFQSIVYIILLNWVKVTKGPYGLNDIPSPQFFGLDFSGHHREMWFLFTTIVMVVSVLLISFIMDSPFGRTLKSIRDDEIAAASLGKNVPSFKIRTFALAAGFAAVAGMLYAGFSRYINPSSFTIMESVFILSIIIIGGAGNLRGPIIGSIVLVILPELLRELGMNDAVAANVRQIIYGLAIIFMIRWRPQGLLGNYTFS